MMISPTYETNTTNWYLKWLSTKINSVHKKPVVIQTQAPLTFQVPDAVMKYFTLYRIMSDLETMTNKKRSNQFHKSINI